MTQLKEYQLSISGKADVVIFDAPTSEALALRAERGARAGGFSRRRTFVLNDKSGQPLLRMSRTAFGARIDAHPDGGAILWASRFQTRYRITLSSGLEWFVHVPLFTERFSLSAGSETSAMKTGT
jgi:hypothetical protein